MKFDSRQVVASTSEHQSMSDDVLSILYLFVGLAYGVCLTYVLSRSGWEIDYTVILFITGILTAITTKQVRENVKGYEEALFNSILLWETISPELIVFIFLPVLVFGESQSLKLHTVNKVILSSLFLSLLGAAFTAYMIAIICKQVLRTGWSWTLCWLVGCVLCPIDPIAVVVILKATHQSRLQCLIVCEALLSDGIALVLYGFIGSKTFNEEKDDIPASFTIFLIKVLVVSPLLGLAVGLLTVASLKFLDRPLMSDDPTMQIVATFCCAYLSFFVAQYSCEVSGVLSCFISGLVVSYFGRPLLLSAEAMEQIWRTLEYSMNTLIFLVSGLIVGSRSSGLSGQVVLAIVAIYVGLFVLRLLLFAVCHVPMKWLMPHFSSYSWREAAFSAFAGLRGATSLALVLLLSLHSQERPSSNLVAFPSADVEDAVFVTAWVVALTIIINGTLASRVFRCLGLVETDSQGKHRDSALVSYVSSRLHKAAAKNYNQLARQYPTHDHSFVLHHCSVLADGQSEEEVPADEDESVEFEFEDEVEVEGGGDDNPDQVVFTPPSGLDGECKEGDDDGEEEAEAEAEEGQNLSSRLERFDSSVNEKLLDSYRVAFLQVVNLSYLRQISEGKLPRGSRAAIALLDSVDVGFDTTHTPGLHDFGHLVRLGLRTSFVELLLSWARGRHGLFNRLLVHFEHKRETEEILALQSFVEAHQYAQAKIPLCMGPSESLATPEEAQVLHESGEVVRAARRLLSHGFSSESRKMVTSRKIAATLIHATASLVLSFYEEGILVEQGQAAFLHRQQMRDLHRLKRG